jgi:hypothetical protein
VECFTLVCVNGIVSSNLHPATSTVLARPRVFHSLAYWDVARYMAEIGIVIYTGSAMGVSHFGLVHGRYQVQGDGYRYLSGRASSVPGISVSSN